MYVHIRTYVCIIKEQSKHYIIMSFWYCSWKKWIFFLLKCFNRYKKMEFFTLLCNHRNFHFLKIKACVSMMNFFMINHLFYVTYLSSFMNFFELFVFFLPLNINIFRLRKIKENLRWNSYLKWIKKSVKIHWRHKDSSLHDNLHFFNPFTC